MNDGKVAPLRGLGDLDRWKREKSLQKKLLGGLRKYSRHFLKPASNGETALEFFTSSINSAGVYLLDEPENSLSLL